MNAEEENFYRVSHLILDEIPFQLRKYFIDRWNTKYHKIPWEDTANSGNTFLKWERSRSITTSAYTRSNIENGDTCKWDGTTLFAVLLYSSHKLLQADQNAVDCIDNLRQLRNECFAHLNSARVKDPDYQQIVKDLKYIFTQMNWSLSGITTIENRSLVTKDLLKLMNDMKQENANNKQLEARINAVETDLKQLQAEFISTEKCRSKR